MDFSTDPRNEKVVAHAILGFTLCNCIGAFSFRQWSSVACNLHGILMFDLLVDFWGFLRVRKKYWLAPVILLLLLISVLVLVSQKAAVSLIYTVF